MIGTDIKALQIKMKRNFEDMKLRLQNTLSR